MCLRHFYKGFFYNQYNWIDQKQLQLQQKKKKSEKYPPKEKIFWLTCQKTHFFFSEKH